VLTYATVNRASSVPAIWITPRVANRVLLHCIGVEVLDRVTLRTWPCEQRH
jgi:hypothetical protein